MNFGSQSENFENLQNYAKSIIFLIFDNFSLFEHFLILVLVQNFQLITYFSDSYTAMPTFDTISVAVCVLTQFTLMFIITNLET